MDQKKENMKLLRDLIFASFGVISIIAYLSKFFFYVNGYFQFNEWITVVISLVGALIGGIFTMLGVVLTLNKNISWNEDKEKKEKEILEKKEREEIKVLALQIYSEIEVYVNSIREYTLNVLDLKIKYALTNNCDGDRFEEKCKQWIWINDIYFMSDNIKDNFYALVSKDIFQEKNKLINSFIKLNINHERTKQIFYSDASRSVILLNNMNYYILNKDFIGYRIRVFSDTTQEIFDNIKNNPKQFNNMVKRVEDLGKELEKFKEKNIISEDIETLLIELKEVMENNA